MSKIISEKEQLNIQQQEAVERSVDEFTKIIAGAGTGKTKIISKRFYKLVCDLKKDDIETPEERLLVITFTEKAAAEMKERILKELKDNDIQNSGQDFSISTIHGFCSKFLRKHSIEANLSPNFDLINEKQQQEIYQNIVDKIMYDEVSEILFVEDVLKELNLSFDVLSVENILKLKKITSLNNLFDDIFNVIKKVKSLGMTPSEFMQNSLNSINQFDDVLKNIPFGFKNREEYAINWQNHLSAFADSACLFDKDVFEMLFSDKVVLDKNGARTSEKWTPPVNFYETINETTELEISLTKIVAVIYGVYSKILESLDLADFDDLINKTLLVLENNNVIRSYYQKFYKHIIVDEFQDTSTAQMKLLLCLLNEKYPNLTIVGDRKQSIYSFRFAQMENVDIIQKVIEKKYSKKYQSIQLVNNYRSTPQVLEVVNSVTQNQLKLEEVLLPNPTLVFPHIDKSIKISKLFNIETSCEHKIKEARFIASEILSAQKEKGLNFKDFAILVRNHKQADILEEQLNLFGIPVSKKVNSNYFEKKIVKNILAFLELIQNVRNELALVKILQIQFSQRQIYLLRKEVDKCFSSISPNEDFFKFNFSEKILEIIEKNAFEKLNLSQELKNYVQKIYSLIMQIQQEKKQLSLPMIFYKLGQNVEFVRPVNTQEFNNAKIDAMVFEKILIDYVKQAPYVTMKTFLEYIDEIKKDKNFELPQVISSEIDAVQVMTIHASKGLEFPYVFLAGVSKGKSKDRSSIDFELKYDSDFNFGLIVKKFEEKETPKNRVYKSISKKPKEDAEDLRLFYVALTRAKTYLNVISFEPFSKKVADYFLNLEDYFPDLVQQIDVKNLEIEQKELPKIKLFRDNHFVAPKISLEKDEKFKLSFSRINVFNQCNEMYFLKYVQRFPVLKQNNYSTNVGTVFHNLVAGFYLNRGAFRVENIDNLLTNLEIDNKQLAEIKAMYKNFIQSDYSQFKEVLSEYSFEFTYRNVEFKGDIDLLKKNSDGSFDIYDFKTNKDIQKSLSNYYKQMLIYKLAMENIGFKINKLILINVKTDEIKEFDVSSFDLEQAEKSLILDIEKIKELQKNGYKNITVSKNLDACKTCYFSYVCNY